MSLTPEEQRAVEAACGYSRQRQGRSRNEQEERISIKPNSLTRQPARVEAFALGYLDGDRDGFKRGVEAAMRLAENNEQPALMWTRIRALLAQEEPRG